ncbi:phenylalanine--tRNA ligase subunit alpha [Patescibacteria group bacterium]|nr:phenylalanine--tRNA ligase subunit alpha [Patescibacteria group bacterium]MBU1122975.1 phenylalanine--tRNA ligase subunit alpha [Patescibacteria group bacterium]MBU1911175.1 phenylalanine--tRNA ligase subunit alpha [Patescibacteria group bacterium]
MSNPPSSTSPAAGEWSLYAKKIKKVSTLKELEKIEQELFGRKNGAMTIAMKKLKDLSPDLRKQKAQELNKIKQELIEQLEQLKNELETPSGAILAKSDSIDVTLDLPQKERGHLHLIPEFIRHVEEVFGRMGFDVARGPEIEDEKMNFDLLNFPKEHAARDAQDIFYINRKAPADNKFLLRAHTSPVQIRYMKTHKPPFRAIFPGKVYRKDADATHSPMFHQFEGLMIGKDITLANMKAVMIETMKELISQDAEFRFRTGYFPFVEPGLEVDVKWEGEKKTKEGTWLEIVGCGMVHPNVLKNCNIDPDKWQGFAFGFGADRMVMIKHQIPSIKELFPGDVRFLRQF